LRIWLSPDGSQEVVATAVAGLDDKRITVLPFKDQIGLLANVQRGLEAALASSAPDDLFAFADQDDIWHNDKLAKSVAALPAGLVAACTHDARVVDSAGQLVAPSLHAYERRHDYLDQLGLLVANTVSGMTMLMTRDAVLRSVPFPQSVPEMLHDWWIALVVSGAGSIRRVDEALVDYRQHQANRIGAKRVDTFSHFTLNPRRSFLGKQYREMARHTFKLRRHIATELRKRDALSPAVANLFLERDMRGLLRPWRGGAAKYAFRCWIGMALSAKDGQASSQMRP
jgi:O-antigen biosynthesis protein